MNSRERFLAIFLVLAIAGGAGGFVGYVMILEPYDKGAEQERKLKDEVKDLSEKKDVLVMQRDVYENKMRKMSLPLDSKLASIDYDVLLEHMLVDAKFEKPQVTSRVNDKGNVPMLPGKKPAYVMIDFEVKMTGELQQFVGFLYNFYRQPLLHEIKKMGILKPMTSRGGEKGSHDLNFSLSIQALVLDRAEDRATLLLTPPSIAAIAGGGSAIAFNLRSTETGLGSPFAARGVLARGEDKYSRSTAEKEYSRIAGKNIFFDPPPKSGKGGPGGTGTDKDGNKDGPSPGDGSDDPMGLLAKDQDFGPYLQVTRVSHCNGVSKAAIRDRLRNEEYEIEMNAKGEAIYAHYWYLPERNVDGLAVDQIRKKYPSSKFLEFGSEDTNNLRRYAVRRITENELILEIPDVSRDKLIKGPDALALGGAGSSLLVPPKVTVWRVGQFLTAVDPKKVAMGELANANSDPKRAAVELKTPKAIREVLLRPLELDNEGNGTIEFASEGELPPKSDGKKTGGKGSRDQKGKKGKGSD